MHLYPLISWSHLPKASHPIHSLCRAVFSVQRGANIHSPLILMGEGGGSDASKHLQKRQEQTCRQLQGGNTSRCILLSVSSCGKYLSGETACPAVCPLPAIPMRALSQIFLPVPPEQGPTVLLVPPALKYHISGTAVFGVSLAQKEFIKKNALFPRN